MCIKLDGASCLNLAGRHAVFVPIRPRFLAASKPAFMRSINSSRSISHHMEKSFYLTLFRILPLGDT
jgi:hypothetical protein